MQEDLEQEQAEHDNLYHYDALNDPGHRESEKEHEPNTNGVRNEEQFAEALTYLHTPSVSASTHNMDLRERNPVTYTAGNELHPGPSFTIEQDEDFVVRTSSDKRLQNIACYSFPTPRRKNPSASLSAVELFSFQSVNGSWNDCLSFRGFCVKLSTANVRKSQCAQYLPPNCNVTRGQENGNIFNVPKTTPRHA